MQSVPFGATGRYTKQSLMHNKPFGVSYELSLPFKITGQCTKGSFLMHYFYITLVKFRHKNNNIRFRKWLVTLCIKWNAIFYLLGESYVCDPPLKPNFPCSQHFCNLEFLLNCVISSVTSCHWCRWLYIGFELNACVWVSHTELWLKSGSTSTGSHKL